MTEAWHGKPIPSRSRLFWPVQTRPTSWALWKYSLARLFLRSPNPPTRPRPADLALRTPMGRWYPHHSEHRLWTSYANQDNLFILQSNSKFRILPRDILPNERRWMSFRRNCPHSFTDHIPAHILPCPITLEFHSHFRTPEITQQPLPYSTIVDPEPQPDDHTNLLSFIQALPTWESNLLSMFTNCTSHFLTLRISARGDCFIPVVVRTSVCRTSKGIFVVRAAYY